MGFCSWACCCCCSWADNRSVKLPGPSLWRWAPLHLLERKKDKFMLCCEWFFKNASLKQLDDCQLKRADEKKFEPKCSRFSALFVSAASPILWRKREWYYTWKSWPRVILNPDLYSVTLLLIYPGLAINPWVFLRCRLTLYICKHWVNVLVCIFVVWLPLTGRAQHTTCLFKDSSIVEPRIIYCQLLSSFS